MAGCAQDARLRQRLTSANGRYPICLTSLPSIRLSLVRLFFVATIVATLPFMFVFQGVGQPVEVASALARIVVAAIVTG